MRTRRIAEQAEKLPKTYKFAIFDIIDDKVESDMDKVLLKIENIEKRLESKMDTQFKMLLWTIGVSFTILSILITTLKFIE
ncbi:hypothetical protein [Maribacter polysaccharolyticus]|uniref:hypothetical protein n=1 Tax=Maribacter polysaccharolyticus TaxID=3020831 RepID=UPI00237FCFC9|nr:hypothetical protein [Maribacter polysaccharolyticus]MDE3744061.1 hypothetical protein [Maribacter polysaccharolyticus]